MANNKTKSSKATKASKKPVKVVVPEPQILLLASSLVGNMQPVRFEHVHIGTAFLHAAKGAELADVFLKVGKTSAMCLQSNVPEGSSQFAFLKGAKVSFGAATKVELCEIDLSIKLKGKPRLGLATPIADASTKVSVDAVQVSDLSSAVLERAGS